MSTLVFKDHFSNHADLYLRYRPLYPANLYTFLSSLTKHHTLAWDCGSGNGQAAIGLAAFYNQVVATDASEQQISNSLPHDKIKYKVEKAEHTSFESHSVDIVTIANALHWFDFDLFYKEVNRVLKSDGVIAVWTYELPTISPEVDIILRDFH